MSVDLIRQGLIEPPTTTALTGTSATTIIAADASYRRVVEKIVLANVDASNACTILLHWVSAAPASSLLWSGEVAAKSSTILDLPVLLAGNGIVRSLTATAGAGNDVTVTVFTSANTQQDRER